MRTLSNDKIIAHKRNGDHVVFLIQEAFAFFLIFARISNSNSEGAHTYKILAKKELSYEEAEIALMKLLENTPIAHLEGSVASDIDKIILLEDSSADSSALEIEAQDHKPVKSPYFPTKEIFLSHQMTGAPNSASAN